MATPPRQILPGQTYFVTGRAIGGSFRFVPSTDVTQTIRYCLASTLEKYSVQLHGFVWMSNHYHLSLTDVVGELPDFMRDLNSLISKSLNTLRDFRGANFEKSYNLILETDEDGILEHCAYTEANPCQADLVEKAKQWTGVTSVNMSFGEELRVERPKFGMWANMEKARSSAAGQTNAPEVARLKLERPPVLVHASDKEVRKEIRQRVMQREQVARESRVVAKRKVMGMRRVQMQSWYECPRSCPPKFAPIPKVAGANLWVRKAALSMNRAFIRAYKQARLKLLETGEAEFPPGTWLMAKILNLNADSDDLELTTQAA